jgi:hypothetical protein
MMVVAVAAACRRRGGGGSAAAAAYHWSNQNSNKPLLPEVATTQGGEVAEGEMAQ